MDNELKKVLITVGGLTTLVASAFIVGKLYGEDNITKLMISLYENGDNNMIARDNKTGLIYEFKTECIGD